jgi:hypothetical protein
VSRDELAARAFRLPIGSTAKLYNPPLSTTCGTHTTDRLPGIARCFSSSGNPYKVLPGVPHNLKSLHTLKPWGKIENMLQKLCGNLDLPDFCSGNLQVGILDPGRCPPEGGRYRNENRVTTWA